MVVVVYSFFPPNPVRTIACNRIIAELSLCSNANRRTIITLCVVVPVFKRFIAFPLVGEFPLPPHQQPPSVFLINL
jgi:hypothetical protein